MKKIIVLCLLFAILIVSCLGFIDLEYRPINSNEIADYKTWFYSSAGFQVNQGEEITGSYLMEVPEDCYIYRVLIKVSVSQKLICDGGVKVRLVPGTEDSRIAEYYYYRHGHITRPYHEMKDEYYAGVYDAQEVFEFERGNWIYAPAGTQLQCLWSCYAHDSGGIDPHGFHCEVVLYTVLAD